MLLSHQFPIKSKVRIHKIINLSYVKLSFNNLGKKKKGRRVTFTTLSRVTQPEIVEPITPVHLSKSLCEVEVADNKIVRFNAEDHLPVISKDEYWKQKKDVKTPNRVSKLYVKKLLL